MRFNLTTCLSFLIMNLTSYILLSFRKKAKVNIWYSSFIFAMSLGQLAATIDPIPFHGPRDIIIIRELIARFSSALSYWFSPYFILLIGIEINGIFKPFQKKIWRILLLIPIAIGFLINFIDSQNGFLYTYLDFSKKFYIVSFWGCVCTLTSNILNVHSIFIEKNQRVKRQKALIAIITFPSLFITYTAYILPLKGPYEFVNLVSGFGIFITVMLLFFAIKYGVMGLKITIEKDVYENTMRTATFGAGIINHAIKNKLDNLQLAATLIEQNSRNIEELSLIKNSINDLYTLIKHISKYSQDFFLQPDTYNLCVIVDSALAHLKSKLDSNNIKVTKCYGIEPEIFCDQIYFKEALINIFNNAIEAVKETKRNIGEIKVLIYKNSKAIHLSIEDNGVGISKENQNSIFRPFFSTKRSGDHFGLGLAYVYHITELHKFKIGITSMEGVGTTITLSFPIKSKRIFYKHR